jgi:hypothetical protein
MVLLVEPTRILSEESNLIDDDTDYTTTSVTWVTLHDYGNISLFADSLVVFYVKIGVGSDQTSARLKIGSCYVWGKNSVGAGTYVGVAYVPGGIHNVLLEGRSTGGGEFTVDRVQIGKAILIDRTGYGLASYSSAITLRIPARVALPVGALKNAVFMVRCWAKTTGAQTNFESPGDSLTNGVSLAVDGVQVAWTERNQDTGSVENACATYYGNLSIVSSHTFTITKDNAGTTVHISVYASPWLLGATDNEPVTLDFSQGSTLYVTLEPLSGNPTKTGKLGKKRAVSYGDATDYYDLQTGAGLLKYSHTFSDVKPNKVSFFAVGLGGCISYIGVDAV